MSKKLLLVISDPDQRSVFELWLKRKSSMEILAVRTSEEARDALTVGFSPDGVIMEDIGSDMTQIIRRQKNTCVIWVIASGPNKPEGADQSMLAMDMVGQIDKFVSDVSSS